MNTENSTLERDIINMLSEYLNTPTQTNFRRPSYAHIHSNNNNSHTNELNNIHNRLNNLHTSMISYHNNMNLYIRTVRDLIQLRNNIRDDSTNISQTSNRFEFQNNNIPRGNSYNFQNRNSAQPNRFNNNIWSATIDMTPVNLSNNNLDSLNLFSSLFQNVVIRPTNEQIENAVDFIHYPQDLTLEQRTQTVCPISLEHFQENQPVARIRHCGHIFSESALRSWFQQNVRCPLCRYDVRETNNNSSQDSNEYHDEGNNENDDETNNSSPNSSNPITTPVISRSNSLQTLFNGIADELSTTLLNAVNNRIDNSNNFPMRLDIPFEYTEVRDASNNVTSRFI